MKLAWKCAAVAAALSGALVVQGSAQAQTQGLYAGVALTQVSYKEEGFATAKPISMSGRFGNQFSPNVALEGRLGIGVSDDEVDAAGIPVAVEVDYYFSILGKGILPLSSVASLYGLLGFTSGKVTASAFGNSFSASDSDISYGIGGEFNVSRTAAVNLEWARLWSGDGYKVEGLSLGVNFRF